MTRQGLLWGILSACLAAGCASDKPGTTTVPAETEALDATVSAPAVGGQGASPADAGTVRAPEPAAQVPAAAAQAAGAAAPSSKPAAPSSNPDAGSGRARADAGNGKGGSTQSDGKLTAFIEISDIPTGAEAHRCVVVELPNSEPVYVSTLHATLGHGSHHMIIDRRPAQEKLLPVAEDCSPSMGADASRLLIAQQHDTRLDLPEGVGFLIEPKQHIYLQLHYINATDKPLSIKGDLELLLFAKDARPIEAKSSFTGSTSIALPPHQAGESSYFHMLPANPSWNVFALTSHTHQLGVHSTIERVASASAAEITPLHESRDWAEPPLTVFEKPLVFDGSDGLRLTCRYMNTTDRDVHFGTGVADEMCFMWLYYFVKP